MEVSETVEVAHGNAFVNQRTLSNLKEETHYVMTHDSYLCMLEQASRTSTVPEFENVTRADRLTAGADLISPVNQLLDVGCGDGSLNILLQGKARLVVGVDAALPACREARAKGFKVQCADLNACHLPYRDGVFDAVTCLDVIEHVLDPRHLLRELARVLRPHGVLVVTTPNTRAYWHILTLVRGRFPRTSGDPEGYDGGHLHYFTFADVCHLLNEAGFDVVEEFGLYRWTSLTTWGRIKERIKAFIGDRLKREFFSGGVVVRATRST